MTRPSIHPGEILREEFLRPKHLTPACLAAGLKLPEGRVAGLVREQEPVCADMALRLARYFGTSERFWMELQMTWDLDRARHAAGLIEREVAPHPSVMRTAA